MTDEEEKRAIFKKLNARATALKMDLHDLSESLPTDWERIPEVAEKAHRAFKELMEFKNNS
jgi:hypothetical protein